MPILGALASGGAGSWGRGKGGVPATVSGGTLFTSGGFNYRLFTSTGTLTVADGPLTSANVLLVAGGGSGGNYGGGGGGAGGVLERTDLTLAVGTYPITVGGGGAGDPTYAKGGDSAFNNNFTAGQYAEGGGKAYYASVPAFAGNGGSGAGGGGYNTITGGSATGNGLGNNGGNSTASPLTSGTGGGAGLAGGSSGAGGSGGDGTSLYSTYGSVCGVGDNVSGTYYFGGGGRGGKTGAGGNGDGLAGPPGGGGRGGRRESSGLDGTAGVANTGGGGGGGGSGGPGIPYHYGKAGGSGVVIVRYPV